MNGHPPPATTGPQVHAENERINAQLPSKDTVDTRPQNARTSSSSSHRSNAANESAHMPSLTRKRTARRTGAEEHNSSADEAAPIIRHARGDAGQADYQSISASPRLTARGGAQQNNTEAPRSGTQEAEREAAEVERSEGRWWGALTEKYGSVELENKGSVARDHLALERTFLAWLRTSLSFASIGIAITQLFRLNTSIASSPNPSNPSSIDASTSPQARLRHVGKPLGATFIGVSIVILFIGFHRYFEAQHYVIRGKFPASRGSVLVVSAIAGALIVSSLVVILAIAPRAFET